MDSFIIIILCIFILILSILLVTLIKLNKERSDLVSELLKNNKELSSLCCEVNDLSLKNYLSHIYLTQKLADKKVLTEDDVNHILFDAFTDAVSIIDEKVKEDEK